MSESDHSESESSSDSSVFNDGYDSDLIGDDQDRRNLDNMTEKEREEEIYRRTEQRDLLLKRFEMKKAKTATKNRGKDRKAQKERRKTKRKAIECSPEAEKVS